MPRPRCRRRLRRTGTLPFVGEVIGVRRTVYRSASANSTWGTADVLALDAHRANCVSRLPVLRDDPHRLDVVDHVRVEVWVPEKAARSSKAVARKLLRRGWMSMNAKADPRRVAVSSSSSASTPAKSRFAMVVVVEPDRRLLEQGVGDIGALAVQQDEYRENQRGGVAVADGMGAAGFCLHEPGDELNVLVTVFAVSSGEIGEAGDFDDAGALHGIGVHVEVAGPGLHRSLSPAHASRTRPM